MPPLTAVPSHAVIAGVNKAGTTSLFTSLSQHPAIAAARIKETRHFLPARYGRALDPISAYDRYFSRAPSGSVRLEATPSYLYGGSSVAEPIGSLLPDPRVLVLLREPVSRALSFFRYQKARLRFPADLSFTEHLRAADGLTAADFDDPANERYMAFRGGLYMDFLPEWFDVLGPERLRVIFFEDLVCDPAPVLSTTLSWLGLAPDAALTTDLSSENRTTGYRSRGLQRVVLSGNDRLEPFFRRHMRIKRSLRALYYCVNGQGAAEAPVDQIRTVLADRYAEPNARLARLLTSAGIELPVWLDPAARAAFPDPVPDPASDLVPAPTADEPAA